MAKDPYASGLLSRPPYAAKRLVSGRLCAVLDMSVDDRGLQLIQQPSRAVAGGEVHELLMTDESDPGPGAQVDAVCGVGFFIVDEPGVILRGDRVRIGGSTIGTIAGFDETHAPNHYNIVIVADTRSTGVQLGISVDDAVEMVFSPHDDTP